VITTAYGWPNTNMLHDATTQNDNTVYINPVTQTSTQEIIG